MTGGLAMATAAGCPIRRNHLERHGLVVHWTDAVHETQWVESRSGAIVRRLEAATVPFAQAALMSRRCAWLPSPSPCSRARPTPSPRPDGPGRGKTAAPSPWSPAGLHTCSPLAAPYGEPPTAGRTSLWTASTTSPKIRVRSSLSSCVCRATGSGTCPLVSTTSSSAPPVNQTATTSWSSGEIEGWTAHPAQGCGRNRHAVKICCRRRDLEGQVVPSGVEVLGYVDRDVYRDLLGRARVVAIAARPLVYPSGQSVLLEAMAMGRTAVVTQTEALAGYVSDGGTALTVAPGDASALRERIVEAASDDDLRCRLGLRGRDAVERTFNARRMWETVAHDLLDLCR